MKKRWLVVILLLIGVVTISLPVFAVEEEMGVEDQTVIEAVIVEQDIPEYEQLFIEAGELLIQDKPKEAQVKLEKAKKLVPNNSAINRQLGEVYIITDKAKAENLLIEILVSEDFQDIKRWASINFYNLAEAGEGIQPAIAKLEAEAKKDPKNLSIPRQVAEGYVCLRDWGKVVEIYEDLEKKQPNDTTITTRLIDYQLLNQDYDSVIKKLEAKVKKNPEDKGASDILMRAYTGSGKAKEALALYKQRIELDPNSAGLRGRYAQTLMEFGMLNDAAVEWKKCSELDPSNLFFKQRAAETYLELEDLANAKNEFSELLKVAKEKEDERYQAIAESGLANIAE